MATSATSTTILGACNRILLLLEREPMASTADLNNPTTLDERIFAAQFDAIVKAALAVADWPCITLREELAMNELASSSNYYDDWSYSASLPGKLIRLSGLQLAGTWSTARDEFLVESGVLYTNTDEVLLKYLWYPRLGDYIDQASWEAGRATYYDSLTPLLRDYLEVAAAYRLERIFVKSDSKRQELYEELFGLPRGDIGAKARAISESSQLTRRGSFYGGTLPYTGMGWVNPLPG